MSLSFCTKTLTLSRLIVAVFGLAILAGLAPGYLQRERLHTRRQLLALLQEQRQLAKRQLGNLQHQFRPGYKANHPLRPGVVFSQGEIVQSNSPTHLAIHGQGCFAVCREGLTRYTRGGQFEWRAGLLCTAEGWTVQGFALDSQGNPGGQPGPLRLALDPSTNLYASRYTGFHFDESGKCFGESTMTDPVTGQSATTLTPLFQLALYQLQGPILSEAPGMLTCKQTLSGLAGQGALGQVCPGSLELANMDFAQQATLWQWLIGSNRWACVGMPASEIQEELRALIASDREVRQACLDNLKFGLHPGYRSTAILPILCGESAPTISQEQGPVLETHSPTDLALDGEGYFVLADGRWTRCLDLSVDRPLAYAYQEQLQDYSDQAQPMILPSQASNLEVTRQGIVRWTALDGDGRAANGFRLVLAKADRVKRDGAELRPQGPSSLGRPDTPGFASVIQGSLEISNEDSYQRRLVGAALMDWAGLPLLPESRPRPESQSNIKTP